MKPRQKMKRTCYNFRDEILSSPGSSKRRKLKILLDELTKPEIDVAALSQHTTMIFSHVQKQNTMIIPQLIRQIQRQSEPLVLEITKNNSVKNTQSLGNTDNNNGDVQLGMTQLNSEPPSNITTAAPTVTIMNCSAAAATSCETETGIFQHHPEPGPLEESSSVVMHGENTEGVEKYNEGNIGEKQFEIIFSDSAQPNDADDSDNHIIHSTTECSADAEAGTVNVPNSFPLFQIVHTGEVPEDLQQEIVRLIREANPQLDLNSITFKFTPPETVEIIANINS